MNLEASLVVTAAAIWAVAGVWLAVIDWRSGLLPTKYIWPTAGVVWVLYTGAALIESEPTGLINAALGALGCGAALAVVYLVHPPSMGFGDVRLSVLNGLLCGWWGWYVAFLGLMAGFVLALPTALVALVRHGPRASRPLGPYLVAGTAVTVLWSASTQGLIPVR